MPTLKVTFNKNTKVATVLDAGGNTPAGSVAVGTFVHPNATYPDSYVIYHGVQELLYKRSAADPSQEAMYPHNIINMQEITIDFKGTPPMYFSINTPHTVNITEGDSTALDVEVQGGKAPLAYAWYLNHAAIKDATHAHLGIANATLAHGGEYYCEVTDANGTVIRSHTTQVVVAPAAPLSSLTADPSMLVLSLATDATNGKTVKIAPVPSTAEMGTVTIKTAPSAAVATATIAGGTLTVKPVAAGPTMAIVEAKGKTTTIHITVVA